ncbi:MAG: TIM barrel protein [Polyangiales bacterium]
MPRFAANLSLLFTEVPLVERFARARAAGFSRVEIQFPYEAPLEELARARRDADVACVLVNVPAGDLMQGGDGLACVPGREAEFRDAVERAVEYAEGLGAKVVNVLSGRVPEGVDEHACLDLLVRHLAHASGRLASIGVKTTCEAINTFDMPRFLVHRTERMHALVEAVGHASFGIQYDVYHMARMGEDVLHDLRTSGDRLFHVQFADIPGRGAPGTGTLDFDAIFGAIDALPYEGAVAAEYRPGGPTEPTLAWLARHGDRPG